MVRRGLAAGRLLRAVALVAGLFPGAAAAEEVLLLTSYEAEVVDPVLAAFAGLRPDITVRHLNKNTNAAVDEILAGNDRRFDLFWASAAEAFEVLGAERRLEAHRGAAWTDFAYSAVGWTWKAPLRDAVPQDWNELLLPAYSGRIAMSHPMRSGTTHSLIETVLQDRGWEPGWAWTLELAGQLNTISARSFGVLEAVEQGFGLPSGFLGSFGIGRRQRQEEAPQEGAPIE